MISRVALINDSFLHASLTLDPGAGRIVTAGYTPHTHSSNGSPLDDPRALSRGLYTRISRLECELWSTLFHGLAPRFMPALLVDSLSQCPFGPVQVL